MNEEGRLESNERRNREVVSRGQLVLKSRKQAVEKEELGVKQCKLQQVAPHRGMGMLSALDVGKVGHRWFVVLSLTAYNRLDRRSMCRSIGRRRCVFLLEKVDQCCKSRTSRCRMNRLVACDTDERFAVVDF